MYLSRVEIDYKNRQKMRDLNHLGAYHHWVESMFPDEIAKNERSRKLWRIDRLGGKYYLLLLSDSQPDAKKMEQYGVEKSAQTKLYTPFLESLQNGMRLRFKATLNPVKSLSSGSASGKRGRVVPLLKVDDQMKFLLERAAKHGFELDESEFYITETKIEIIRKKGAREEKVKKTTYEGVLTIVDSDKFQDVLINGLGKRKAYGCGMITVMKSIRD